MKRKTVIILAAVVACILIATIIIVATTQSKNKKILAEISNQNPLFPTVDFIQSWYACDLTAEEWDYYFDVLKSLGFDTVILQWIFSDDGGANIAYYESETYPCDEYYSNTLELMLTSADNHDLDVYVGTYSPTDWWSTNYNDNYIQRIVDIHNTLFEEVYTKYHNHKSFVGWYYSPEMFSTFLGYEKQWIKLLNGVIDGIEQYGNNLPLIFSPYRGKYTSPFLELDNTFARICKQVKFRQGDILAPQDGFGAKSPKEQRNAVELYKFAKYCYDATKGTNLTLWINCELFSAKGQFCSSERMLQQFRLANAFCNKTLCFSFAHYAFKAEDKTLFNDYKNLYNDYRLPTE